MCENPIIIYKNLETGAYSDFKFDYKKNRIDDFITVPCKHCAGCQESYRNELAYRALAEVNEHNGIGMFITLTVNDDHIDEVFPGMELQHRPFQLFMKRLRKKIDTDFKDNPEQKPVISYLMCGEYGERYGRPHYHACIFGYEFDDMVERPNPGSKFKSYISKTLSKLWPYGFHTIGSIGEGSVKYLAKYVTKKRDEVEYCRIPTETTKKMVRDGETIEYKSMKYIDGRINMETGEVYPFKAPYIVYPRGCNGGLGYKYFMKNYREMFKKGYVLTKNGSKMSIPHYFKRKCQEMFPEVYNEWQERALELIKEEDNRILEQEPQLKITPIQLIQEMFPGIDSVTALEIMDKEDESLTSIQKQSIRFQSEALTRINLHIWKMQQYEKKGIELRKSIELYELKKKARMTRFKKFLTN